MLLSRQQVVPFDSLLGLLAHAALAVGVIAASLVRGPQLDLMAFLFGDIFAITSTDLRWIYLGGARWRWPCWSYVWRPLLALSVHEDLAAAEGTQAERVKLIFVLVLALVVAIAIKIVGVLLTIAFLIMPAAAARPLSETPEQMALFAAIFGALSVALGLFLSVSLRYAGRPVDRADAGAVLRRCHLPHHPARPTIECACPFPLGSLTNARGDPSPLGEKVPVVSKTRLRHDGRMRGPSFFAKKFPLTSSAK